MLNWADLSSLCVTAAGLLGGIVAVQMHDTGWCAGVFFSLGGVAAGFGLAIVSSFLSYRVLAAGMKASERRNRGTFILEWATLIVYMLLPMLFILVSSCAPMGVASLIYGS